MKKKLIELKNIEKVYHMGDNSLKVLDDVSLVIEEGDFVAIMGPSGSGKSTLLNLVGCLDVPTEGQYCFGGRDISTLNEDELALFRRHELGFIFQQFNLLSFFDAAENVALPLLYSEGKILKEKSAIHLENVGLADRSHHLPKEMSGGQQQRVAIARALVNSPRLILADEPTGNLDSQSEAQVLKILRELNQQGMTIVMVTHEDEIGEQCNRVIRMRDGKILSDVRNAPIPNAPGRGIDQNSKEHTALTIAEHFRQGLKQLASNKVRTFLSVLGVLIGVASVVTMLAIGKGAQKAIESQLSSMGANILMLRSGVSRAGGAVSEAGATASLYPEDAAAIRGKFSEVAEVAPNVSGRGQAVYKNKNWNPQVMGVTPEYSELRAYRPSEGRFFTHEENLKRARVAVIGATVHRELFEGKAAIGETIKLNKNSFTVIGVLPEKGASGWRDQDDLILIPLQTGMRRLFGRNTVDAIDIQIAEGADMSILEDEILEYIQVRHRIPEASRADAFKIHNMADIQQAISESGKTMTLLLTVIAAVSLLVGGIGIMNIMLVSVTERTKEIGLRKAIGATRKDILFQFLVESVVVGVVGGIMGIISGVTLAMILNSFAGWATAISPSSIVISFVFSLIIGLVFGVYPARNASKLHPIEALRSD
jgi:macrolide transport system ATP-binding/permease protein